MKAQRSYSEPAADPLSYSRIFTYLNCSLKYRFRYLDKRAPEHVSIALAFGSAVHKAVQRYYQGRKNQKTEPLSVLQTLFEECLQHQVQKAGVPVLFKKQLPDVKSAVVMGKKMITAFYSHVDLAEAKIVAVELPLGASLHPAGGIRLVGILDLVLKVRDQLWLVDHKTAVRAKSQDEADADLQMSAYSYLLAANGYVPALASVLCRFDVLRKLSTPIVQHVVTVRTAAQRQRFAKIAGAVMAGIHAGVFAPRHSYLCADCEYRSACCSW